VAKVCGICGFRAGDEAVLRKHMRRVHQWDHLAPPKLTVPWRMVAVIVSALAVVLFLLATAGMADIGYKYSPGVMARINMARVLLFGALLGLNVTAFMGKSRGWPHTTPAATLCLLIVGVSLYVILFTPIS